MISSTRFKRRFSHWFLDGMGKAHKQSHAQDQDSWWKVMCLTGVDYFSSLGYAPGIAYLAAGLLSPIATLVLVMLTLFGALPVYCKVAEQSPHGQGSIAMLERLLPRWRGKLLVLALLGFAATDFIITITLSAADAATHLVQNPWVPMIIRDRMLLTLSMLVVLGAIFLRGFKEAIGLAVVLVSVYLFLNVAVLSYAGWQIFQTGHLCQDWLSRLFVMHGSVWQMLGLSCLLFPKLALGMSGFETGVAVMPHVRGNVSDTKDHPIGRIRHTRLLLATAAGIMSVLLMASSIVTTLLIPPELFRSGGEANGRALAYLAHRYLGDHFGTTYDISTLLILWFAGASAMAGLLNLVPRYLPRYGMAPDWARARRPLIIFFILATFVVTLLFQADVDAQGGAYATGVLVLMTSAALASFLIVWKESPVKRWSYGLVTIIFFYTTIVNSIERPDGIKIASFFIIVILTTSLISRALRSTELRVRKILLDPIAEQFVIEACRESTIRLVAHRPGHNDYAVKAKEAQEIHNIAESEIIFLEVKISDASQFGEDLLEVKGEQVGQYKILRCNSPAVPNALAALLLFIRDKTGHRPCLYLGWTEGNPIAYILKYLFFGEGETAPVTREILREIEPNPKMRPGVHVG